MMSRWVKFLAVTVLLGCMAFGVSVLGVLFYYTKDLPDYRQLAEYQPPIVTRLYAEDGRLIEEYAKEKRLYVSIKAIPQQLINAFLAAEDKNFFKHGGIDVYSIIRAALTNVMNIGREGQLVGGSTITQQVVKNFLLTNEQTFSRKVKEAVLAIRITRSFSKERILELYLNQIFLGNHSYGVAAAALNYFNKSINELTPDEMAMLASLPKAPNEFNPYRNYKRAKERRDWVLSRMLGEDYITHEAYLKAVESPIRLRTREPSEVVDAGFYAEAVRRQLIKQYGEKQVYEGGLAVLTSLDPQYQVWARQALRKGIISFDHRKGWRGPLAKTQLSSQWQSQLAHYQFPLDAPWQTAMVLDVETDQAHIGFVDGKTGIIPFKHMSWASHAASTNARDILQQGFVIVVEPVIEDIIPVTKTAKQSATKNTPKGSVFALQQIPEVNGAVVVLDPHTGRVLALEGGFSSKNTQFNRATQALRQPGSAFKPFVYLAAMEKGLTPATIVVDSPVALYQGPGLPAWQPKNYSGEFYGPTPLRQGLEYSRNAMTVQLSQMIGIDAVVDISKRFDILDKPDRNFSLVLGSAETTLLRLVNAYSIIVNGGKKNTASLIEKVQDRHGKVIYRRDNRQCSDCFVQELNQLTGIFPPNVKEEPQPITDPQSAYQVISMMQGVVQRGTAVRALQLGKTVGGKTGTTNNSFDTWFIGFTPDIVVGTYIGYDTPRTLGKKETGASVSLPVFIDFMENYFKDKPDLPFRIPEGIKLVRIDRFTGQAPTADTPESNIIMEAFKVGKEEPVDEDNPIMNTPTPDVENPITTDPRIRPTPGGTDTEGLY